MKLNANGLPIDEYNEHDLPDAKRQQIIEDLATDATLNASQKELHEAYWKDVHDFFSGLSDEELLEDYKELTGDT